MYVKSFGTETTPSTTTNMRPCDLPIITPKTMYRRKPGGDKKKKKKRKKRPYQRNYCSLMPVLPLPTEALPRSDLQLIGTPHSLASSVVHEPARAAKRIERTRVDSSRQETRAESSGLEPPRDSSGIERTRVLSCQDASTCYHFPLKQPSKN